jgi:hypothetical protein
MAYSLFAVRQCLDKCAPSRETPEGFSASFPAGKHLAHRIPGHDDTNRGRFPCTGRDGKKQGRINHNTNQALEHRLPLIHAQGYPALVIDRIFQRSKKGGAKNLPLLHHQLSSSAGGKEARPLWGRLFTPRQ